LRGIAMKIREISAKRQDYGLTPSPYWKGAIAKVVVTCREPKFIYQDLGYKIFKEVVSRIAKVLAPDLPLLT
jgi:hypothetical protein